jgi:hypothetical protein
MLSRHTVMTEGLSLLNAAQLFGSFDEIIAVNPAAEITVQLFHNLTCLCKIF